jgi:hypothetical protein
LCYWVIKCYIYLTFLYGAETRTLDKKAIKKIEALEMWIYRRLGKIVWSEKKTNNEVLKQLKLKREQLYSTPLVLQDENSRYVDFFLVDFKMQNCPNLMYIPKKNVLEGIVTQTLNKFINN